MAFAVAVKAMQDQKWLFPLPGLNRLSVVSHPPPNVLSPGPIFAGAIAGKSGLSQPANQAGGVKALAILFLL